MGSLVSATVQHCYVDWPEFINKTVHVLKSTASWEFKEDITAGLEHSARSQVLEKLAKHFAELDGYEFAGALAGHRGMWMINVSNNAGTTCEDVRLSIPMCKSANIYRDGMKIPQTDLTEVICLGDLRAKDCLSLSVWVGSVLSSWDEDKIRLNYKNGMGTVRFLYPSPSWASRLANNWPQFLWLCVQFFIFWTAIVIIISASLGVNKTKHNNSVESESATNVIDGASSEVTHL